mmetsp:Transcript_10680/g.27449  ORF Transcript_10680/g.27449 Transcript_10680/m.27449 type:complete len:229 (-) Transcript_10680:3091-3777(-)
MYFKAVLYTLASSMTPCPSVALSPPSTTSPLSVRWPTLSGQPPSRWQRYSQLVRRSSSSRSPRCQSSCSSHRSSSASAPSSAVKEHSLCSSATLVSNSSRFSNEPTLCKVARRWCATFPPSSDSPMSSRMPSRLPSLSVGSRISKLRSWMATCSMLSLGACPGFAAKPAKMAAPLEVRGWMARKPWRNSNKEMRPSWSVSMRHMCARHRRRWRADIAGSRPLMSARTS